MMDLNGKVALVTGAAIRVGRTIAHSLAERGADVAIHYGRSEKEAHDTVDELKARGVSATSIQANLADPQDIDKLFEHVEGMHGRIDILVNSASAFQRSDVLELTLDDWNYTMDVNLRAPFLLSQRAARLIQAQGSKGVIINIADAAGVTPWMAYPQHSVSKAGLIMLTRVMAKALGPSIRVNAVIPGPVLKPPQMTDDRWAELGDILPMGRPGAAENVAHAVLSLIENDFATGSIFTIDGGDSLMGALDLLS